MVDYTPKLPERAEFSRRVKRWNHFLQIAPVIGSSMAMLARPDLGRHWKISAKHLGKMILGGGIPYESNLSAIIQEATVEKPHERHWMSRGWKRSLALYQASRTLHSADRSNGETVRANIIRHLISTSTPPRRQLPDGASEALPPAGAFSNQSTIGEQAITRRTTRVFQRKSLRLEAFSGVLWYSLADTRRNLRHMSEGDLSYYFRSHGANFEYYCVVFDVDGLESGVYYYDITNHAVVLVSPGNYRDQCAYVLQGQSAPKSAAFMLVLATDFRRAQWLYRHDKALRIIYLDAGWVAQDFIWVAAGYSLAALTTPAMRDSELCKLLHLKPVEWSPIYTVTFGLRSSERRSRK